MGNQTTIQNHNMWDRAKDVLSILVIPSLFWVLSISVEMESQRNKVQALSDQLVELKTSVKDLQEKERVLSLQLARIETQLATIQSSSGEIQMMLRQLTQAPRP